MAAPIIPSHQLCDVIEICGICHKKPIIPTRLKCLHAYCENCLSEYISSKLEEFDNEERTNIPDVTCPACFIPFSSDITNFAGDTLTKCLDIIDSEVSRTVVCVKHGAKLDRFCNKCQRYVCCKCPCATSRRCRTRKPKPGDVDELSKKALGTAEISINRLKISTDKTQEGLARTQTSNRHRLDSTKEEIKNYFCHLRNDILRYLFKQEDDLINEVNEHYNAESIANDHKDSGCKSLLQLISALGNMLTTRNKPGIASHQLMSEITNGVEHVESLLVALAPRDTYIELTTDSDKKMEVLRSSFAEISVSATDNVFTQLDAERNDITEQEPIGTSDSVSNSNTTNEEFSMYLESQSEIASSAYEQQIEHEQTVNLSQPRYSEMIEDFQSEQYAEEQTVNPRSNSTIDDEPPPYYLHAPIAFVSESRTEDDLPYALAIYSHSFKSLLSNDKRSGYVVGVKWLGTRMIMADRWNRRIKLFSYDGMYLQSLSFGADSEPWDLAVIRIPGAPIVETDCRFCLTTLPKTMVILKIAVPYEGKLEVSASIKTSVGYCCVAYDSEKATIVCGVCQPFGLPRVDVVSMAGNVLRSFALDGQRVPLFKYPRSVDITTEGTIVVCDWNKHQLTFIRSDGFILGCYRGTDTKPLTDPVGTQLDHRNYVYVTDKKSNCIHITKLDGSPVCVMDIDKELFDPREISLSTSEGRPRMALSHGAGFISVFNLLEGGPPECLQTNSSTPFLPTYEDSINVNTESIETTL